MHVRRVVADGAFVEGNISCGWCGNGWKLGESAVICTACEHPHHGRCWEDRGGCSHPGCAHVPRAPLHRAPQARAPGAVRSLVVGVVGFLSLFAARLLGPTFEGAMMFLFAPPILGIVAIRTARSARKAMAADPTLSRSWATGGLVVGIIDVALWTLVLFSIVSSLLRSRH